ncbi:hypothetical protein EYZ11_007413 [Aspergillus tanneri]|uniref:Uncharacterized protein n=1 Tax=Aspergillus tanneri TaxID=1220188 RepID=A0A4S3JIP0_9EURO|nr:hypothetical protein EYZ11_007413 [Aspergillus tanneri]
MRFIGDLTQSRRTVHKRVKPTTRAKLGWRGGQLTPVKQLQETPNVAPLTMPIPS